MELLEGDDVYGASERIRVSPAAGGHYPGDGGGGEGVAIESGFTDLVVDLDVVGRPS